MTKRQVEIDDVLPDCVEQAIEEVNSALRKYIKDEQPDRCPDLGNDLDYDGRIHEIIDSSVPIWFSEIEAAWFLHGRDLETAYENAWVGENPRENNGIAAIYYYIEQKVGEWYSKNADRIWHDYCSSDE